jgi:hypothetical protein
MIYYFTVEEVSFNERNSLVKLYEMRSVGHNTFSVSFSEEEILFSDFP